MSAPLPRRAPQAATSFRWKRANVWLGKGIPLLLLVFAWKGWELVLYRIIPDIAASRPRGAILYAVIMHAALAMTLVSYFKVYLHSRRPPDAKEPPKPVRAKRIVYACDEDGEPLRCYRDSCGGAWQALRTRHCRDCGTCRPVFDHHCAFMDNCIDAETHKAFFCFVCYAAVVVGLGLGPLLPQQWRALRTVVGLTWSSETMSEEWWRRWYSWLGGPVWRYAGGVLLGYRQYARLHKWPPPNKLTLATPSLATLAITFSACMIVVIAISMIIVILRNAAKGLSTVQIERARIYRARQKRAAAGIRSLRPHEARLRVYIPPKEESSVIRTDTTLLVEPDIPLFDFGWRENLRRAFGFHAREWFNPWQPGRHSDLDQNPKVVAELRARASKQTS